MILTKSKMQVTFVLLFLSWFFNVVTCVDVLPARKRSLYDIAVQERHALIKWDPRIDASRYSRPVTLLRSLIVELQGPERINSAEELRLTTIITNTGSKPLMLVNEPSGVLYSRRPTDRFYVTHSTGMIPQFKGVQIKFSVRKAIELGDVTMLLPGQSTSVIHDLSAAYDLTVTGFGQYNFKPRNRFFVVNPATKRVTMVQAASTHGTSVEWSRQLVARGGDIPVVKPPKDIKYSSFSGCKEGNKKDLESARENVVARVQKALSDVQTDSYVTWFGKPGLNNHRRQEVTHTLNRIIEFVEKAYYACSSSKTMCPIGPPVTMVVPGYILGMKWLTACPSFLKLNDDGDDDERVSAFIATLIRYKRFTKLDNHAVDEESCKELAEREPDKAVKNADSFVFFVLGEQSTSSSEPKL